VILLPEKCTLWQQRLLAFVGPVVSSSQQGRGKMRRISSCCAAIVLGTLPFADSALADPVLIYSSSGSCIVSPFGFDSKLRPVNSGVAWRTTFNAVGSADADGKITEVGQSVDSASFGVGPRMHVPAANAYQATFSSTLAGPNEDGSFTLHVGTATGTFTAGLYAGLTFTASGFKLTKWTGSNGLSVYGNSGAPAIQNVLLSNGTKFERICAGMTISLTPIR
jgi:hypothetical protein